MASKKKKKSKNKRVQDEGRTNLLCEDCSAECCHKLLVPFKRPRTERDIYYYKWHLQYDTVSIIIRSNRWYLVIEGRCIYLDKNNLCTIYDRRPDTCREHNPSECERYGAWYDVILKTPENLEAYLEKEKKRRRTRRQKAERERRAARSAERSP